MRPGVRNILTLDPITDHDGACATCADTRRTTFTGKARPYTIDCPRCTVNR